MPDRDREGRLICDRCKRQMYGFSMSFFNEDLCCDECLSKERTHPRYKEARDAERAALEAGNRNFPGIGLPPDLRGGT